MKREILFSLALHVAVLAMVLISSPFDTTKRFDFDEVIRIRAVSLPAFSPPAAQPATVEPVSIPQATVEETPEIPIDDPSTVKKPKEVEKPKPKPKPTKADNNEKPKEGASETGGNGGKQIDVSGTGPGSPFGSATIDNASFDYPYWFTQAFNKIASNFRNTVVIDGRVVCVIYFQVIRSGRLVEARVENSSGVPAFDRVCLAAVEQSAPFPPLPREFREEIIGITVPFTNASR